MRYSSFAEFYPFYLGEHAQPATRRMHFAGSALALLCLLAAVITGNLRWLGGALLCGYGFAWAAHLLFEKNRPATFRYPLYSFMGDWVMYKDIWASKVKL